MRRPYWYKCHKCGRDIYCDSNGKEWSGGGATKHKCWEVKNNAAI